MTVIRNASDNLDCRVSTDPYAISEKQRAKSNSRKKKPSLDVSPSDTPLYGFEALIATIDNEKELQKALKKASRHNANFTRRFDSGQVS